MAIRVREQKEGASDKFDILLRVGDKIVPYKGVQNIIDAIAAKQDDLLPLRNGIGGEPFYMHHDCNLESIGTFKMATSTLKAANGKPVVDFFDHHWRFGGTRNASQAPGKARSGRDHDHL